MSLPPFQGKFLPLFGLYYTVRNKTSVYPRLCGVQMPTIELRDKLTERALAMFKTGRSLRAIAESLGVPYTTIWTWLSTKIGGGLNQYATGVKARRARMMSKLGYSTKETGKLLGCCHSFIAQLLKRKACGSPVLLIRFDQSVADKDERAPVKGKYARLTWVDEEVGRATLTDNGAVYLLCWSDLLGNVSYAGLCGWNE